MKILHVSRSVAEFSYHESIIRHLLARGHEVVALFNAAYSEGASDAALARCRAELPGLSVGWSVQPSSLQRRAGVAVHELATFASYLSRPDQSAHYLAAWERLMPTPVRQLVGLAPVRRLVAQPAARRALRTLSHRLKPDPAVARLVREVAPDVVVASPTNMRFSYEAAYIQAGRALGIRTVLPVFSWDNLTNKGLIPVHPDLLLAWNATQAREAEDVHGVPRESIVITGSPFFDKWFSSLNRHPAREAFCRKVGLDPERPFLCYLGSTNNVAPNEVWLVTALRAALLASGDPRLAQFQILVRPHPRNAEIFAELSDPDIRVWPRAGALPDTGETMGDFSASLAHGAAVVGVNTTGMLDAIVADAPVITVLTEQYRGTQEATSHFKQLLQAQVLEIATSPEAVVDPLRALLDGNDRKREARHAFVTEFIRPHGLEAAAGEVAARAIEGDSIELAGYLTAA